jgi:hypothetical protein
LLAGWGEDRRLALHGSTNKEKEKRELTDSFLNRRRGSVKPLPAGSALALGSGVALCNIYRYFLVAAAALPATINARFSAVTVTVTIPRYLRTAAKMLNQMEIAESQSFESLRDR